MRYFLAIVRSDLPHAVIEDIDASEAKIRPRVQRILTETDLDPMPRIPVRVGCTPTLESRLQTVLAVERVSYRSALKPSSKRFGSVDLPYD